MRAHNYSTKLALCLATVWLVWGSSFMFTKIAVATLPPALFSGIRFTLAGTLLLLFARIYRGDRWPRGIEWRHVFIAGFFMVLVSNGLNTWAIQYLPSSQSALLNGTSALWIAGLGVFGPRAHPLDRAAIAGLMIGIGGAALMLIPTGPSSTAGALAQLGVLAGCFGWSLGTLYYRNIVTDLSFVMFVALQMLAGGGMLLCIGLLHGDLARWNFDTSALIAMGYLTFCSSCLAYVAYGWLTVNATPPLIGTYSYVNPAIAAFLGWEFLHEHLSILQLAGMVFIMISVGMLTINGVSSTSAAGYARR